MRVLAWIMPRIRRMFRLQGWPMRALTVWLFAAVSLSLAAAPPEPHWIRIESSHFSVLTDADEKRGHEVAARFEQMRAVFAQLLMKSRVNMPQPIDVIAFKDDDEYEKAAPSRQGSGLGSGFFMPGEDRAYFVLNLSHEENWCAVSSDFARLLLYGNYPPTQAWFDEGLVEYFSSLHLTDNQMRIGGDPSQSFVALLNASNWLSLAQLFVENPHALDEAQRTLFRAQSWIVFDYLLHKEQLPAIGAYFGLIENEKLSVDDALEKALGMSSAQLEQAVKDYFHAEAKAANAPGGAVPQVPAPVTADMIGTSMHQISGPEAQALVAEMKLRLPDRRQAARQEFESIVGQPKADNAVVHRALAWDFIEQKQFDRAGEELGNAMALDGKDPWVHYYLAVSKFQDAQSSGRELRGLANMMQDLHIVLDWNHEFAEAYHLLALAQIEGGGLRAAADSIRAAIERAPRKTAYLLDLVKIYEAGKNWDAATALLERLACNSDPEIASAAKKDLQDVPYLKKYGVPPLAASASQTTAHAPASSAAGPSAASTPNRDSSPGASGKGSVSSPAAADDADVEAPPPGPQIDQRPIQYRKGKLLRVDCSQAPAAIFTVSIGAKTVKLRTADYKALMLIGADQFSCDWANLSVSVNYRPGGQADGDLVSLEVH
jgi:tetratricopeptide (TPR) repeat protein